MVVGEKYQCYIGDVSTIYRLSKIYNDNLFGLTNAQETIKVSKNDLLTKYVKLIPDAYALILLTDQTTNPDVYMCIHRPDVVTTSKEPEIIVRQSIYNGVKGADSLDSIYYGDCVLLSAAIYGETLDNMIEFNDVDYKDMIALYLDDTVDTIVSAINFKTLEKVKEWLDKIKQNFNSQPIKVLGIASDLKELLDDTGFLYMYRAMFNITQVDWIVDLGEESYIENGNTFNDIQKSSIENMLRKRIEVNSIIRYEKDIDISKIVNDNHIVISDANGIIYLIVYTVLEDYPIDADILSIYK